MFRCRDATCCVAVSSLAATPLFADDKSLNDKPGISKDKFTIGKETSYAVGPPDEQGYVECQAALNERLGKGITRDYKAVVLICKALGPHKALQRIDANRWYDRIAAAMREKDRAAWEKVSEELENALRGIKTRLAKTEVLAKENEKAG